MHVHNSGRNMHETSHHGGAHWPGTSSSSRAIVYTQNDRERVSAALRQHSACDGDSPAV